MTALPWLDPLLQHQTGGDAVRDLRAGFAREWITHQRDVGCLDAPQFSPSGSHIKAGNGSGFAYSSFHLRPS